MGEQIDPARPGPQVAAASMTSATTGFVVWAVDRLFFHGGMPPEVYGFLQVTIPSLMGFAGAEFIYWRQKHRQRA